MNVCRLRAIGGSGLSQPKKCVEFHWRGRENRRRSVSRTLEGWVAEWSIAHAWKACERLNVPGVRIPPHPRSSKSGTYIRWGASVRIPLRISPVKSAGFRLVRRRDFASCHQKFEVIVASRTPFRPFSPYRLPFGFTAGGYSLGSPGRSERFQPSRGFQAIV